MNRNRRALIVGGTIISAAWLALRVVPSGVDALRLKEESIGQRAELLARARSRIDRLPTLDDSLRALDVVAETLPQVLLVGLDAGTASVDLMRRIRSTLELKSVRVVEFEPQRRTSDTGPLSLTSISVSIETDFAGLLDAIAAIEDDPALAVESLDVRAAQPHADTTTPEHLIAAVGVSGWYRRAEDVEAEFSEDFAR